MARFDFKEIRFFFLRNGYLLIIAAWLFTFSFLFNNFWSYYSSEEGVRQTLQSSIHSRQRAFDRIAADTALIPKLLNRSYSEQDLQRLYHKNLYFFAFDNRGGESWETFWSTNTVKPQDLPNNPRPGSSFVKLNNGDYVMTCKEVAPEQFLVGLIPVKMEYQIENDYLVNSFFKKPAISDEYSIHTSGPGKPVLSYDTNRILFYLYHDIGGTGYPPSWISIALWCIGCICMLIFINQFATLLARKVSPLWGFTFLLVVVVCARIFTYIYPFPIDLRTLQLFDATIYARDDVFRSLGDLLLNVMLTFWLILFFREHVRTIKPPAVKEPWQLWLIIILSGLLMFIVGQFYSDLIQSLVADSQISFDVTNVFGLDEYSVVGSIVLGFIAISFLFFSQIVNYLLNQLTDFNYRSKYLFLAIVGLIWLAVNIYNNERVYDVAFMTWLLAYVILLDLLALRFEDTPSSVPFLFWMLVMTVTTSAVLVYHNNQKERGNRVKVAEKLSKRKDVALESYLKDVNEKLSKDAMVQAFFRFRTRAAKDDLRQQLDQKYFTGSYNNYRIDLYTFDQNGTPLFNDNAETIDEFDSFKSRTEKPLIADKNLYYEERSFNDYSYIGTREIREDSILFGYIRFVLTPLVAQPERPFPSLLVEGIKTGENDISSIYSYAVYDKNVLVNNNNDYPFPVKLYGTDIPMLVDNMMYKDEDGYSRFYYRPTPEKLVIIVKKDRSFVEFVTLFAYMFCLFLIIIAIYAVFDLLIKARMRRSQLKALLNINIRKKVQGTIIFVVVFAFIVLGVTTILFFINRYQTENAERLSKKINAVAHDLQAVFQHRLEFDEMEMIYDSLYRSVNKLAENHDVDLNLYDRDGNLRLTTQPLLIEKGLIAPKVDPMAYFQLTRLNKIQFIQNEKIGKMSYLSGYIPIRDGANVLAYLNVPSFATETELNNQISNFLVVLINFNALILLIAGLLALFITNTITRSFSLVTNKLRSVNLGQHNDEIEWEKDDEIGVLVREYNKMVRKLEVSAAKLAKSEREGAWREMARQVAHEIKNPLTPMKLSIQYLQRAIANDSPNVKVLSQNVANTLVEQIEHLSNIASDFSAFAHIGQSNSEEMLLNELLYSLTGLYQGQPGCEIIYEQPEMQYQIFADKTQMNRLFTNLLQNAIQAMPEGKQDGRITIGLTPSKSGYVTVSVRDNGHGIPEEVQPKIFVPNFTTKSSGTGLGLAMCKNIVEQARGEIWFETEVGLGTTFYVKLPLIEE
ncbi:HAMP domain-containing sensor histidine kinase [uncultured Chitinophaga sp.]|uniref:sensor histidine kinase n=1 Tax=uncultured Chitinophaga sp. TaxID=339340 RepID=UPI0025CF8F6C|nr:HAMP domain-containing sensor histidine kinase [uncultured Chitinophaga sp.]